MEEAQKFSISKWQSFPADKPKQIFIIDNMSQKTLKYSDNFSKLSSKKPNIQQ